MVCNDNIDGNNGLILAKVFLYPRYHGVVFDPMRVYFIVGQAPYLTILTERSNKNTCYFRC